MRRLLALAVAPALAWLLVRCASPDGAENEPGSVVPTGPSPDAAGDPSREDAGSKRARDAGVCSADFWCSVPWVDDSPTPSLRAVWSFAPNDVVVAGDVGPFQWDGASWTPSLFEGGLPVISSLWASGHDDLWGLGYLDDGSGTQSSQLFHGRRSGGAPFAWSNVTIKSPVGVESRTGLAGRGATELWLISASTRGKLFLEHGIISDAGSPEFNPITPLGPHGTPLTSMGGLYVSETHQLYLSATDSEYRYRVLRGEPGDGGYVWTSSYASDASAAGDPGAVTGFPSGEVWALLRGQDALQGRTRSDGGDTWTATYGPDRYGVGSAAWGSGPEDVWAVGYYGQIRHWDGSSWAVSRLAVDGNPIYNDLYSIHGSSTKDVWAVGEGVVLHRAVGDEAQ